MAWGDPWGSSPSRNAKMLAAAFYDGQERKRGRYEVKKHLFDIEYLAFGRAIARRTIEENVPEIVRQALIDGKPYHITPLSFCWQGFSFEKDIARHLRGLGVPGVECACKETRYQDQRFAEMCGKPVSADMWYTLEEAAQSELQHPAPRKMPAARARHEFEQRTTWLPGFELA